MNSCRYQQRSEASPNQGSLRRSRVFYNLNEVGSETLVFKHLSDCGLLPSSKFLCFDAVANHPNLSSKAAALLKNYATNESIKRTPSSVLLSYCKEILGSYNVSVKPIFSEDEAFLGREDVELLARILESNDRHSCLDERDRALLEEVLQMNLAMHIQSADDSPEKIENMFLKEIRESENPAPTWTVFQGSANHEDEIITAFHDAEPRNTSYASCLPMRRTKSLVLLHDLSHRSISVDSSQKGSTATLRRPESTSGFGLSSGGNSQIELTIEEAEMIQDGSTKIHGGILEKDSVSQISQMVDCSEVTVDVFSDWSLSSEEIILAPPPSMISLAMEQQSNKFREVRSWEISRKPQSNSSIDDENLYTDQALKKSEEKLLQAINAKLTSEPSLPMTLSTKIIRHFEVRRILFELYAYNIEYTKSSVYIHHKVVVEGLCEEFEIKHLTFEELVQKELFFKIEQNDGETCLKPMDVGEITANPGSLLTMLEATTDTTLSERLADKIRHLYDSEKYSEILEEDFELDLHSARSESDLEALLHTTKSSGPKVKEESQKQILESLACKNFLEVGVSKDVGVLFDNENYDPQISSRSRKSDISREADNSDVEVGLISGQDVLFDYFAKFDPLTLKDLLKYMDETRCSEEIMERNESDDGASKQQSLTSFRSIASDT